MTWKWLVADVQNEEEFFQRLDQSAVFLNRVVPLKEGKPRQATVEPDSRHVQILLKELGLEQAKGVETPVKD